MSFRAEHIWREESGSGTYPYATSSRRKGKNLVQLMKTRSFDYAQDDKKKSLTRRRLGPGESGAVFSNMSPGAPLTTEDKVVFY